MKIHLLSMAFLFGISGELFSQTASSLIKAPDIVPPPPSAQVFMRYGEIPVDYSTGVPRIEIPLYTIKGKQLELPISISYHASGIKVNDIATDVGLGWVLNCSGMIARTAYGKNDEHSTSRREYLNAAHFLNTVRDSAYEYGKKASNVFVHAGLPWTVRTWLTRFESDCLQGDFECQNPVNDRYFYRLPGGESGIFRFDDDRNIVTLPYSPIKIDHFGGEYDMETIQITDKRGVKYIFRCNALNSVYGAQWHLLKMISADETDYIEFKYNHPSTSSSSYNTTIMTFTSSKDQPILSASPEVQFLCHPLTEASMVESIETPEVIINFEHEQCSEIGSKDER